MRLSASPTREAGRVPPEPGARPGGATPRLAHAALAAVFTVLALAVALCTPPWEANDEPSHVQNVETLLEGRWYRMEQGAGGAAHQAPLYYLVLAAWQRLLGEPVRIPRPQANEELVLSPRTSFAHEHGSPADREDRRLVARLRLPSVLFGLITLLFTAGAARRISADPWTPVVAAAVVAGVPKFVFLSGVINNDNLSNALGGLLTLAAVGFVTRMDATRGERLLAAALLGALLGLLVATKLSAATLALGVGAAIVVGGVSWGERAELAALAAGGALVTCGWWLVQNQLRYGELLAVNASLKYLKPMGWLGLTAVDPFWTQLLVTIPRGVYRSFWYVSGWNQFTWPWWAYVPLWAALLLALSGLIVKHRVSDAAHVRAVIVLATLALGALSAVWLIGLRAQTFQARIAFVGLPAIGCLAALGLERLGTPILLRFAGPALGLAGTLIAIQRDILRLL